MNKTKIENMIRLYKTYELEPPIKGKYKRDNKRIYFLGDFKDGEEVNFFWNCEKSGACAIGNAFYINKDGISNLINISELV